MQKKALNLVYGWFFLVFVSILPAAYLSYEPVELEQPDGTRLNLFASGDEFYNWLHDKDGYTIRQDSAGWYVYLDKQGPDELTCTELVAGRDDPAAAGLRPGVNLSAQRIGDIRSRGWTELNRAGGGRAPSSGTLNNLVIFIRFSDQAEFGQNISTYSEMFNGTTGNTMQAYFLEASYNQLNIPTTFYPTPSSTVVSWQDTQHARSYFCPYSESNPDGYTNSDQRRSREHTLLANAVIGVRSQIPTGLNVDGDGDGKVDNVCFIIAGSTTAWASLLWPHRWALYSQSVYINGKLVYDYNFQLQNSLSSSGASVLSHEMFHSLGAPDLYRYVNEDISPAGSWDLMNSNTTPPQHMTAYMKWKYGHWIPEIPTLYTSGTYTLNTIKSASGQCFRINSPNSATEYFVVEFRKKTEAGTFDSAIPGSGMLICRINTTCGDGNADGPPDELYVYRPGGTPTVNGTVSSAHFSLETGRVSFNDSTNPSCFLTNGSAGGIFISAVSSSAGPTMTFGFTFHNPPLNLTGTSADGSVTLSWDSPAQGTPASYRIYRDGALLAETGGTGYEDWNVIVGETYTYAVKAVFANPAAETDASNGVEVSVSDVSSVSVGAEIQTGRGLPVEPFSGFTYSQSIFLQSELNTDNKSISSLAWQYNGNSAWTDSLRIYMGHTDLSAYATTASWIPLSGLTMAYNGSLAAPDTAGWIELELDTPFDYNNTQNLVIAVDENTPGRHNSDDEFYCTAVTGNRSLHFYSDSVNPDPAEPPVSGSHLYAKAYVPNTRLTFRTYPAFAAAADSVAFGPVMVSELRTLSLSVLNSRTGKLVISSASLSNNYFYLYDPPAFPVYLNGGEAVEFTVRYNPQAVGTHAALLNITDNLSRQVHGIPVTGIAFNAAVTAFPWTYAFNEWQPENWTFASGTYNWDRYPDEPDSSYCGVAALSAWPAGSTAALITPPLRPGQTSKLTFKWSHLHDMQNPSDTLRVCYSTNKVNWALLWQAGNSDLNSGDGASSNQPGSFIMQEVALPSGHTEQNFFLRFEAVSGNGGDIFIDDISVKSILAIRVTPTTFAFGAVAVGTTATQAMTVQNNGETPLTGYFTTPAGYSASAGARDGETRNYLEFVLPRGGSQLFDISFAPAAATSYNKVFVLYSNDPVQPSKMIWLYGTGYLPARISVMPDSIVSCLDPGSQSVSELVISNVGDLTLDYEIQVSEPGTARNTDWISLNQTSGNIAVGQSHNITATLFSTGLLPGNHEAVINISSNDPVVPLRQIPVTLSISLGTPEVRITTTPAGIMLSWDPVPGATSYRIYHSGEPCGEYEPVAEIGTPQYLDAEIPERRFYRVTALYDLSD